MARMLILAVFYAVMIPAIGVVGILWTLLTGSPEWMYWSAMWAAWNGMRLTGVEVDIQGLDRFDHAGTYIFMCNHVSNLDPPIVVPSIPRRSSVLVKKELFRIPILSRAMRLASFVAVDRKNRDAAIASVQAAREVMAKGVNITIFPEGTRSTDGRLLPFKKGPFHLALESGGKIIPMSISGTQKLWPKGEARIYAGKATLVFHAPVDPAAFPDREALSQHVREIIASGLPEEMRS